MKIETHLSWHFRIHWTMSVNFFLASQPNHFTVLPFYFRFEAYNSINWLRDTVITWKSMTFLVLLMVFVIFVILVAKLIKKKLTSLAKPKQLFIYWFLFIQKERWWCHKLWPNMNFRWNNNSSGKIFWTYKQIEKKMNGWTFISLVIFGVCVETPKEFHTLCGE